MAIKSDDESDNIGHWRIKAKKHLTEAAFEKCHMKLLGRNSPRYLAFGIVYPDNVCKIYLTDVTHGGKLSGETHEFKSIDEMLDHGWDVD